MPRLPELHIKERDARAYAMRLGGATYEDIGRAFDISKGAAHKAVQRHLKALAKDRNGEGQHIGLLVSERYEMLLKNLHPFIRPTSVIDPETGEKHVLPPNMEAVDRYIKILKAQQKLYGLNEEVMRVVHENAKPAILPEDQAPQSPDEFARKMVEELLATDAVDGPYKALLESLVGSGDVVDGEIVEDAPRYPTVAAIPATVGSDDPPEWVDEEEDYLAGTWTPPVVAEDERVGGEMP